MNWERLSGLILREPISVPNVMANHLLLVEVFHQNTKNLLVSPKGHQSHLDSSSGDHGCLKKVIYKLAWLIKNIITCGSLFNKVTSVIDCNMNGVFGHLRRNICSHYIITASDCTLWRTNSLSRRNSLKVDLVQHWIKSVMTVIWRQKSRNKIVLSCK